MSNKTLNPSDLFKSQLISRITPIYKSFQEQHFVIWGTGAYGKWLLSFLKEIGLDKKVVCFCDSFHDDTKSDCIDNVHVYSPSKCASLHKDALFIIASSFFEEILEYVKKSPFSDIKIVSMNIRQREWQSQLIYYTNKPDPNTSVGFNLTWFPLYEEAEKSGKLAKMLDEILPMLEDQESKDIIKNRVDTFLTGDMSYIDKNKINENTYFSDDFYSITSEEVFFDCGAYTGDTVESFINFTHGKYKKILAFEPDSNSFNELKRLVEDKKFHDVDTVCVATGKENGTVDFLEKGDVSSKIIKSEKHDLQNTLSVKITKLDNYIDYKPTFIKMDIEGAELDSLIGASSTIKKYKPKLAICLYHLPFDAFTIPHFLKSIVPEYKFKIRQHFPGFFETILYAYI